MNVKAKVKKRPGRKRRVAGWTLLVLGLLVTGVSASSAWWYSRVAVDRVSVDVNRGIFTVMRSVQPCEPRWITARLRSPGFVLLTPDAYGDIEMTWNGGLISAVNWMDQKRTLLWVVRIELWPIMLAMLPSVVLLLRSGFVARRRAMTGSCIKCGYSLAGLAEGAACPECGNGAGTR